MRHRFTRYWKLLLHQLQGGDCRFSRFRNLAIPICLISIWHISEMVTTSITRLWCVCSKHENNHIHIWVAMLGSFRPGPIWTVAYVDLDPGPIWTRPSLDPGPYVSLSCMRLSGGLLWKPLALFWLVILKVSIKSYTLLCVCVCSACDLVCVVYDFVRFRCSFVWEQMVKRFHPIY